MIKFFMCSSKKKPGLLFALTKPKPAFAEDVYNQWYTTEHIVDVVSSGISDLATRYKNVDPAAKWPNLALYRVPDLNIMTTDDGKTAFAGISITSDLMPEGKTAIDLLDSETGFAGLQANEDGCARDKSPKGLVWIKVVPSDVNFWESWYRAHLNAVSRLPGYRGTTRYQTYMNLTPPTSPDLATALYILHEFDSLDANVATLIASGQNDGNLKAKLFESGVYEYVTEYRS